jgi:iron complex transport system ATP-binding protein
MRPLLQVSRVSFAYDGRLALADVSFGVQAGEFIGLIGPNSSGKSTLLRLLSGWRRPHFGEIILDGRPIQQWPLLDRARVIAVVASEEHFTFPFSVEQIVLMGRIPYQGRWRIAAPRDREIARQAMEATDVEPLRRRSLLELSSGERQRVMLARALAQEPRVLLLDEPTAHLDIGHQRSFFDLLRDFRQHGPLTVVCALHDLALAGSYADRLLLLRAGELIAQGSPRAVLTKRYIEWAFGVSAEVAWDGGDPAAPALWMRPQKGMCHV